MDVFALRNRLIQEYCNYVTSFVEIADDRIKERVTQALDEGALWPKPLIQLNPAFESGGTVAQLVREGRLHPECERIFQIKKFGMPPGDLRLHRHQAEAIDAARTGSNYVLTTGTGSGKTLRRSRPAITSSRSSTCAAPGQTHVFRGRVRWNRHHLGARLANVGEGRRAAFQFHAKEMVMEKDYEYRCGAIEVTCSHVGHMRCRARGAEWAEQVRRGSGGNSYRGCWTCQQCGANTKTKISTQPSL